MRYGAGRPCTDVLVDADPWDDVVSGEQSVGVVYRADPLQRIGWVREGVPSEVLPALSREMDVPREKLYATLGLARATASRKLQAGQRLSADESERVLGLSRLVGQAEAIVGTLRGDATFDAAKWVAAWLDQPVPALGGLRPADLMDTAEGREVVSNLMARMQSGAYA